MPDEFEPIAEDAADEPVIEPIAEPAPEVIPAPAPEPTASWEREIEVFWANVLQNVSSKVETPIHNFLLTETEALKARLKVLF